MSNSLMESLEPDTGWTESETKHLLRFLNPFMEGVIDEIAKRFEAQEKRIADLEVKLLAREANERRGIQ